MTWNKHIAHISASAGHRLGALRRIAPKLNVSGRASVYKAQIRSVMEYASLCWMNASAATLSLLDRIQKKVLHIIGVNEEGAQFKVNIPPLHHRRQVAAAVVLYKMLNKLCPAYLKIMLPHPYRPITATRANLRMPSHAVEELKSRTHSTGRSFIHRAVKIWNSPPDNIVGIIHDTGIQSFQSRVHKFLLQRLNGNCCSLRRKQRKCNKLRVPLITGV